MCSPTEVGHFRQFSSGGKRLTRRNQRNNSHLPFKSHDVLLKGLQLLSFCIHSFLYSSFLSLFHELIRSFIYSFVNQFLSIPSSLADVAIEDIILRANKNVMPVPVENLKAMKHPPPELSMDPTKGMSKM